MKNFITKLHRKFLCAKDGLEKKLYMEDHNCYRNISGGWNNSHGAILFDRSEYANMTLAELQAAFPPHA